jgi:hypothetical protein
MVAVEHRVVVGVVVLVVLGRRRRHLLLWPGSPQWLEPWLRSLKRAGDGMCHSSLL